MSSAVNPVFLLLALLQALRDAAPKPSAEPWWRCRFCKAPVEHRIKGPREGIAMHPPNNCRYGRKASTAYGPCSIPAEDCEPLGKNFTIRGEWR